jgi:hypothetical protein
VVPRIEDGLIVTDPTEHQTTTTPDATPSSRELAYSRWSSGSSGFADFLRRARAESRLVHERAVRARRAKVRRRPSRQLRVAAASHNRRDAAIAVASHMRRDAAIAVAVAAAVAAFAAFIGFGFFSPLPEVVGDHGAARAERDRTPQREPSPASVGTARPSSPGSANPTEALTSVSREPRQESSGPSRLPSSASVASAPAAPPAPPPESLPPEPTDSPPSAAAPEAAPPDVPASDPPAPAQQAPDPPAPDFPDPDRPADGDFSAETDPPASPDE